MSEFRLPSLGADMDEATVVEWHVKVGDNIKRGAVIVSVETSKGIIDVEFFDDAVIDEICVAADTKVAVGTVLARYHTANEVAPTVTAAAPVAAEAQPLRVSPAARRRARELGVDVQQLTGSGEHGAITLADIEAAAKPVSLAHAATALSPESTAIVSSMRKAIGAAMVRSKREIPHYYLSSTIEMSAALNWLEQHNRERAVTERLVYAVLLVKAVARALAKTPELNGWWLGDNFKAATSFHIGMAISLRQGGLVVPALQHVDQKSLDQLMPEFLDVVARARGGRLRSSDLAEASITITNLGEQGAESVMPIIYPPQVAIVGFGAIVERPWSENGAITSRRVLTATLAADHRVSDGQRGSRFLATLNQLLQEPANL